MKKLLLVAAVAAVTVNAHAQKISPSKVPAAAKAAFAKAHPRVLHPAWEKEDGNFEGNWKEGGTDHSVTFTPDGRFAGSEMDISPVKLPKAAREYVTKNLHAAIKEASLNKDAQGTTTYEADLKGKAYIFDEKGNFIKTEKGD